MRTIALVCAAAALTLAGCNTQKPDTHDADIKALNDGEAQWNADWASKDPGKIAAHYADDAVLMVPGMEALNGQAAISDGLKGMVADPALSLSFHPNKVDVSGDVGYTQGSYKMTMTDPNTHKPMDDHGSYVTTYRRQTDGSWKAVADIATSAVPPPAPAPPEKKKK
jgi:uncharacterized protein (TIGR02246 family)